MDLAVVESEVYAYHAKVRTLGVFFATRVQVGAVWNMAQLQCTRVAASISIAGKCEFRRFGGSARLRCIQDVWPELDFIQSALHPPRKPSNGRQTLLAVLSDNFSFDRRRGSQLTDQLMNQAALVLKSKQLMHG
jgi:hypothetical protein